MADLTDDQLDAIVQAHRRSYGRSDACVCGEEYPCSTVGLVVEVRRLRSEVEAVRDAKQRTIDMQQGMLRSSRDSRDAARAEVVRLTDGIRRIEAWERSVVGEVNDFSSLRQIVRSLLDVAGDDTEDTRSLATDDSLALRHQAHYRVCECLGDSKRCCDKDCVCNDAGVSDEG